MRTGRKTTRETMLKLGAEGGSVTVVRRLGDDGRWRYTSLSDESTLWDMLDDFEGDGHPSSSTRAEPRDDDDGQAWRGWHPSFADALRSLGGMGWPCLHLLVLHPDVRADALAAVRWHPSGGDDQVQRWIETLARPSMHPTPGFEERYEQALRIAAVVHAEHVRKGTRIPYITHVVHVSRLLQQHGAPDAVVLAGLLHDVLEDADDDPRTRERLGAVFPGFEAAPGLDALLDALRGLIDREVGPEARWLAQAVSEVKVEGGESRPWKTRKLEQLAHLRGMDGRVALLKGADTLHNMTAIADDVEAAGTSVLAHFNASPDDLLWYYGSVVALVTDCLTPEHALSVALDLRWQNLRSTIDAAAGPRDLFTGTRERMNAAPAPTTLVIEGPRGDPVLSFNQWRRYAGPASSGQWRAGRSAQELARAWLPEGAFEPQVPPALRALLDSHDATRGVRFATAHAERRTRLDQLGPGRQHDLLLYGAAGDRRVLVSVEAKADEPFGRTVGEALTSASENPASRLRARVDRLSVLLFGRTSDEELGSLRYQLLYGVGAVMLEAARFGVCDACFVVHEVAIPNPSSALRKRNADDLAAFTTALLGTPIEAGVLAGPVVRKVEEGASTVNLYVGAVASDQAGG